MKFKPIYTLPLIRNYINTESKFGGYTSIIDLLDWMKSAFNYTEDKCKFKLANFILENRDEIGLQEASSNKEIGLQLEVKQIDGTHIVKNYLFIRFK